jgi:predicted kinase
MQINLENVKTLIMGIQGSGKTYFTKEMVLQFKMPVWYLVNLDDLQGMKNKINVYTAKKKDFVELNNFIASILRDKKRGKGTFANCDCIVIDEADYLVPKTVQDLQKFNAMYDLFINHRHYKIAVIFLTRRPQDLNPLIVESCEHKFIFALETSDNVYRKMNSIDSNLIPLMRELTKESHKFIYKQTGHSPVLMNAIK